MRGEIIEEGRRAIIRAVGKRVLIVDDDSFLVEVFRLMMEDAGFIVETAHSGQEALAKAEKSPFGLVITDLKLPDITGEDLTHLVKEVNPGVSVVMLTGAPNASTKVLDEEPDEVIQKPAYLLELLRSSNDYRNL